MPKKKAMLWGAGGLLSVTLFAALFAHIVASDMASDEQLGVAMSIMNDGRWDVAGRIARDLNDQIDPENDAAWHYVLGVSALMSVQDRLNSPSSRRTLENATDHLAKAKELGFPAGYKGKGDFYLGWCLFNMQRWDEAIAQLKDSPMLWPAKRSDALKMVVEAQLRKSPPDPAGAETSLERWRAIPGMSGREMARIKLVEAQLALLDHRISQCEAALEEIAAGIPEYFEALVWRGRWRLSHADRKEVGPDERERILSEAEKILRQAKVMADTPGHLRRRANYLSGRCLRMQDKQSEALGTFNAVRQSAPQSAEAIASGIEETEILLELGQLDSAIASARTVLREIEDLSLFDARWLTVVELKRRLMDVGRAMRDRGEYAKAVRMAKDISLAFPLTDSLRIQAEILKEWAERLKDESQLLPRDARNELRNVADTKYSNAGELYERLARLQLRSPEYTDILWRAITCFQEANNLDKANRLLDNYLQYETGTKRPRGFLALGRNNMNAGNWQHAIDPLRRCLDEYPAHPDSSDARLLAALALSELNELDEAVDLLEENLFEHRLQPKNPAWRDSMFALGQLVFRQGDQLLLDVRLRPDADWEERRAKLEQSQERFLTANQRLGEASIRLEHAGDDRHYEAKYMFARSHLLAGEVPKLLNAANLDMVESARRNNLQQRREYLEAARDEFRKLHKSLSAAVPAPENVNPLIRNCYFGEANALYDLDRWEEAIQAYRNVTARFMNKPEALESLWQTALCHRKLDRPADAKRVIKTAKQVLDRIPPELDVQFTTLTRASRDQWGKLIDSMEQWD